MSMTLAPFNSVCLACGSSNAAMRFCTEVHMQAGPGEWVDARAMGDAPEPHLHRTCERCSFEWLERCLGIAPGPQSKDA